MSFKGLFFVHILIMSLSAAVYREPLVKSFLKPEKRPDTSLWISSIDYLKEKLITQGAAPGVVCITHSSFGQTVELSALLQETQEKLGKKAQCFCIDAKDKSLHPFIFQVKQQLGLQHLPLPVFIFFKQSSIILPVQAGIRSSDELVNVACQRFGMQNQQKKIVHSKKKIRSNRKKS